MFCETRRLICSPITFWLFLQICAPIRAPDFGAVGWYDGNEAESDDNSGRLRKTLGAIKPSPFWIKLVLARDQSSIKLNDAYQHESGVEMVLIR